MRRIAILLAAVLFPTTAGAQTQVVPVYVCGTAQTGQAIFCSAALATPVSGAQYALLPTAATALTVPATAKFAWVTVENNGTYSASVNYTDDGTTPTSSVGHNICAGCSLWLPLASLAVVRVIQTAASAAIDVSYYK